MKTNNWATPARIKYWESLKGRKQEKSPNWKGDLNGNMFKNWELEFKDEFCNMGFAIKSGIPQLGISQSKELKRFINETLESQRQQIVQEIQGLIPVKAESTGGKVYAEVSKQAWEMAIKEVLSLPSLQVNKQK